MAEQLWTIEGVIKGAFLLVESHNIQVSGVAPHPSVRQLRLAPKIDGANRMDGSHDLIVTFAVESDEGEPDTSIVADIGREIFNTYLDFLSFLSGSGVQVVKSPDLVYRYPDGFRSRRIIPGDQAYPAPIVPLDAVTFANTRLDSDQARTLAWFRKGVSDPDVVSSVAALFAALDFLANRLNDGNKIEGRACEKCGHRPQIEQGTKQRVQRVLRENGDIDKAGIQEIWEVRNRINHGGLRLTPNEFRHLQGVRRKLIKTLAAAIKALLGIPHIRVPYESSPPIEFSDPMLILECMGIPQPDFAIGPDEKAQVEEASKLATAWLASRPGIELIGVTWTRNEKGEIQPLLDYREVVSPDNDHGGTEVNVEPSSTKIPPDGDTT